MSLLKDNAVRVCVNNEWFPIQLSSEQQNVSVFHDEQFKSFATVEQLLAEAIKENPLTYYDTSQASIRICANDKWIDLALPDNIKIGDGVIGTISYTYDSNLYKSRTESVSNGSHLESVMYVMRYPSIDFNANIELDMSSDVLMKETYATLSSKRPTVKYAKHDGSSEFETANLINYSDSVGFGYTLVKNGSGTIRYNSSTALDKSSDVTEGDSNMSITYYPYSVNYSNYANEDKMTFNAVKKYLDWVTLDYELKKPNTKEETSDGNQ